MSGRSAGGTRVMVLWCPDWPVLAATAAAGIGRRRPAAVVAANRVVACSALARLEGVRRGMRRREAQSRCPELVVLADDPDRDARVFEPVVVAVEGLVSGVEVVRPGLLALVARGPARYFGGEEVVAERLIDRVAAETGVEAWVGVAEGLFAATLAARRGVVVPPRRTAEFLAPLGIGELVTAMPLTRSHRPGSAGDVRGEMRREIRGSGGAGETGDSVGRSIAERVQLWERLGIHTLGEFAALPSTEVVSRFGAVAAVAHRLAGGRDPYPPVARRPPLDLTVTTRPDEPIGRVDTAAFVARALAQRSHRLLSQYGLACTRLTIHARTGLGGELARTWRHEAILTAEDVADRLRWQLDGWLTRLRREAAASRRTTDDSVAGSAGGSAVVSAVVSAAPDSDPDGWDGAEDDRAGIVELRLVPEDVFVESGLQLALWGDIGVTDDRAHRTLRRVQGLLGPDEVLTPVLGGGRGPAERVRLVSWPEDRVPTYSPQQPWPGALPAPSPGAVAAEPVPARVLDSAGDSVRVTGRNVVSAAPKTVSIADGAPLPVLTWTGPWAVDERWWDPDAARRRVRFQLVVDAPRGDGEPAMVFEEATGATWSADRDRDVGWGLLLALENGAWWLEGVYD